MGTAYCPFAVLGFRYNGAAVGRAKGGSSQRGGGEGDEDPDGERLLSLYSWCC